MELLKKTPRIEVVDALRGFAVMAILLVHNLEHFIFPVYPESSPEWLSILDAGVFNAVFSLFAGKSYAIFALLFGFTFYIQSHNQQLKGKDFGYRFLWRLVLLAGFATLNAAFFPAGDVLLLFVVVGIILFIVRKWSDKAILITAILFSLQPIEWFHYIMSLFNPAYTLPDLNVGAMYSEVADYTKNGTFWEFLIGNVTLGQKASLFWAIGAGRFLQTAGLFLFGLYIGRKELFVTSESHLKFWTKALIIAAISFAPLYSLKEQIMQSDSSLIQQTVGTAFDMWQKFAFTIVLIASFILLYQKAYDAATDVIKNNGGRYQLYSYEEYPNVWGQDFQSESLFELYITLSEPSGGTGGEGAPMVYANEATVDWNNLILSEDFLNLLNEDPKDVRHCLTKESVIENNTGLPAAAMHEKVYLAKFPGKTGDDPKTNNICIIRLSEVYLNAAEAGLKKGTDIEEAQGYLNDIISRRTTDTSQQVSTETFTLDRILKERRKELVGEGEVFYDYLRNGLAIERKGSWHLETLKASNAQKIEATDLRIALPIPQSEIDANPNIQQNPR